MWMQSDVRQDSSLATYRLGRRSAWSTLVAAASRVRNAIAMSVALVGGLVVLTAGYPCTALAVIGTGVAGYGVLVVKDLFNPSFISSVNQLPAMSPAAEAALHYPLELDCPDAQIAAVHRPLIAEVRATHEAIRMRLLDSRRGHAFSVFETFERCTEMALCAGPLATRGRELDDYLSSNSISEHEDGSDELEIQAIAADDPKARATLAAAARTRRRQVEVLREIHQHFDRVTAQLVAICASLSLVEAQLVKMLSFDDTADAPPIGAPDPDELLEREVESLEIIEDLLGDEETYISLRASFGEPPLRKLSDADGRS